MAYKERNALDKTINCFSRIEPVVKFSRRYEILDVYNYHFFSKVS